VVLRLRFQAVIFGSSVSVFIPLIRSWTPDPVCRCCGFCSVAGLFSFPGFLSFKRSLPGRLLPWWHKRSASKPTESSNSLRQDLGFPPRLNFVELGLLLPKSPLWFFLPQAPVLFFGRPLWFILQWSAHECCVLHRSLVFTRAFASLGAGTRRRRCMCRTCSPLRLVSVSSCHSRS
jgi:hypothetical protein